MGTPSGFRDEIYLTFSPQDIRRAEKDPVLQHCYATDIGMFPQAEGHFRRRSQGSPQTIIILCVEGLGYAKIGNQTSHPVRPGEFFLIPPGIGHEYGAASKDPWTIQWAHVVAVRIPGEPIFPKAVDPGVLSRLKAHFADITAMVSQSGLTSVSMDGLRWWMSLLLDAPPLAPLPGIVDSDPVRTAVRIMTDQVSAPIGLVELANRVGLSPSRFATVFRQRHGLPPMAFYQRMRLQKACALLAQTTLTVGQVARAVGFEDPLHFSRVFHRVYGAAPRMWRKEANG
jgi:AraC-like DNA-binding protein